MGIIDPAKEIVKSNLITLIEWVPEDDSVQFSTVSPEQSLEDFRTQSDSDKITHPNESPYSTVERNKPYLVFLDESHQEWAIKPVRAAIRAIRVGECLDLASKFSKDDYEDRIVRVFYISRSLEEIGFEHLEFPDHFYYPHKLDDSKKLANLMNRS